MSESKNRPDEAATRTTEASIQIDNLAYMIEAQARRVCSVRGVGGVHYRLERVVAELRAVVEEMRTAVGVGAVEMVS